MKGQMEALKEIIRKNPGGLFTPKDLREAVAEELTKKHGRDISPSSITLLPADLCNGANPLLKKVGEEYECLKIDKTQLITLIPIKDFNENDFEWSNLDIFTKKNFEEIALYVKSLKNFDKLKEIFTELPCISDKSINKCFVRFVGKDEIARYQKDNLNNIFKNNDLFEDIRNMIDLCNLIENFNSDQMIWLIKLIKSDLSDNITNNQIKHYYDNIKLEIIPMLRSKIHFINEKIKELDSKNKDQDRIRRKLNQDKNNLNRLRELFELLGDKLSKIQKSGEIFGVYLHSQNTILLCIKNIYDVSNNSIDKAKLLAESVLAHEFTHHIQMCLMKGNQQVFDDIQNDAVLETVAETVQYLFAEKIEDSYIIDRIKKHSESGVFPGWGYMGESILRKLAEDIIVGDPIFLQLSSKIICDVNGTNSFICEKIIEAERNLLNIILDISNDDLTKAYYLLEFSSVLKDLCCKYCYWNGKFFYIKINVEFFFNEYCAIFYDNLNVWFFSKQFLSFPQYNLKKDETIQNEKLVLSLKGLLIDILKRQSNSKIPGTIDISEYINVPDCVDAFTFYAEYASYECNSDIDNILLYNFQQDSLFSKLMHSDIVLRIVNMPSINSLKYQHYYHYDINKKVECRTDIQSNLLCEFNYAPFVDWNGKAVNFSKNGLTESCFASIKQSTIFSTIHELEDAIPFGLEIVITKTKGGKSNVVLSPNIVKNIIDGTICALHKPIGVSDQAIDRIIHKHTSKMLSFFQSCRHLNTNERFPLPERTIIGTNANYVVWKPGDDLLKYVRIKVEEQPDVALLISGKLFKM